MKENMLDYISRLPERYDISIIFQSLCSCRSVIRRYILTNMLRRFVVLVRVHCAILMLCALRYMHSVVRVLMKYLCDVHVALCLRYRFHSCVVQLPFALVFRLFSPFRLRLLAGGWRCWMSSVRLRRRLQRRQSSPVAARPWGRIRSRNWIRLWRGIVFRTLYFPRQYAVMSRRS